MPRYFPQSNGPFCISCYIVVIIHNVALICEWCHDSRNQCVLLITQKIRCKPILRTLAKLTQPTIQNIFMQTVFK